jgi:hypothetical protein
LGKIGRRKDSTINQHLPQDQDETSFLMSRQEENANASRIVEGRRGKRPTDHTKNQLLLLKYFSKLTPRAVLNSQEDVDQVWFLKLLHTTSTSRVLKMLACY